MKPQEAIDKVFQCFFVENNNLAKDERLEVYQCSYQPLPEVGNHCGCAIGCLVPHLRDWMDSEKTISALLNDSALSTELKTIFPIIGENRTFWVCLQLAHDEAKSKDAFKTNLIQVIKDYSLVSSWT